MKNKEPFLPDPEMSPLFVPNSVVVYTDESFMDGVYRRHQGIMQGDYFRFCNRNPELSFMSEEYDNGDTVLGHILESEREKYESTMDKLLSLVFEKYSDGVSGEVVTQTKLDIGKVASSAFMANTLFTGLCVQYSRTIHELPKPRELNDAESSLFFDNDFREDLKRYKQICPGLFDAIKLHTRSEVGYVQGLLNGNAKNRLINHRIEIEGYLRQLTIGSFTRSTYAVLKKAEVAHTRNGDNPEASTV